MTEMIMSKNDLAQPSASSAALDKEDAIVKWLSEYISDVLAMPVEEIDIDASFQQLGLDSSAAVGMTGDLSEWLQCKIDSAAAYDHPTISALAHALVTAP